MYEHINTHLQDLRLAVPFFEMVISDALKAFVTIIKKRNYKQKLKQSITTLGNIVEMWNSSIKFEDGRGHL